MPDPFLPLEEEICRESQELTVAWRKGRAARVLDSLAKQPPLRAALVAVLVHDLLSKWDPIQGKWPRAFWRAVLARSEGCPAAEELHELRGRYRRRFGTRPPADSRLSPVPVNREAIRHSRQEQAQQIRHALAADEPLPMSRAGSETLPLLRRRKGA